MKYMIHNTCYSAYENKTIPWSIIFKPCKYWTRSESRSANLQMSIWTLKYICLIQLLLRSDFILLYQLCMWELLNSDNFSYSVTWYFRQWNSWGEKIRNQVHSLTTVTFMVIQARLYKMTLSLTLSVLLNR